MMQRSGGGVCVQGGLQGKGVYVGRGGVCGDDGLGGGCWPGGEWAVGDGTNQGQGENPPLLPRGIIGGAGYPQYFIPLSHLSLEF